MRRRALRPGSLFLTAVLAAALAGCGAGSGGDAEPDRVAAEPLHDVQANLWEWNWASVATECTDHLGPAGFGGVQVAPPQDSLSRTERGNPSEPLHPWWEVYQPASYALTSRMGDRDAFAAMVTACREAGVRVYVDAVINHMTGQGDTSYGGLTYGKYEYAGLWTAEDFHSYPEDCPLPGQDGDRVGEISDFMDTEQVQGCELVGLADLNTGDPAVQEGLAAYLNDLISLGVSGFRIDAAKHISPEDLGAILALLDDTADGTAPEISSEVLSGSTGEAAPGAYTQFGRVLGVPYASAVSDAFGNGDLDDLPDFTDSPTFLGSDAELVFVANHDSERNGSTLSADAPEFALANAFMLAYGYGVPQVYASFDWTLADESPPADAAGFITDTDCADGWSCVTRDPVVVGMVGFHNLAGDRPVGNVVADGDVVSVNRGDDGFAAFNNADAETTVTLATGLPAGDYCDLVTGGPHTPDGACAGATVTVAADGSAELTLPAYGALALLGGNRPTT